MTQICAMRNVCGLQQLSCRAAASPDTAIRTSVPKSASMVSGWTPLAVRHVNVTVLVQDFHAAPLNSAFLSKMRTVQVSCALRLRNVRTEESSLTPHITQLLEIPTGTLFIKKCSGQYMNISIGHTLLCCTEFLFVRIFSSLPYNIF